MDKFYTKLALKVSYPACTYKPHFEKESGVRESEAGRVHLIKIAVIVSGKSVGAPTITRRKVVQLNP